MASTAASKVLGTYELLELILQHEPTKSVALHRRVNRMWKYIIQRSRILQQKLFLAPEPLRHVFVRVETKDGSTSTEWKIVRVGDIRSPNLADTVFRLHPLLKSRCKRKKKGISSPTDSFRLHLPRLLKFVKCGCADMLVSQPPVDQIVLHLQYSAYLCDDLCDALWGHASDIITITLRDKGGLRLLFVMETLFDLLDQFSEVTGDCLETDLNSESPVLISDMGDSLADGNVRCLGPLQNIRGTL